MESGVQDRQRALHPGTLHADGTITFEITVSVVRHAADDFVRYRGPFVHEYRRWIAPVVLGEGKRLFGNGIPPGALELVETRSTPKGVLITTYRPAGSLPQGRHAD